MEITQIRAFLALAEELHFGRASQRLFITQPTLSRVIRALEAEVGQRLFERNTRSVTLTSAGETFVQPAKEIDDSHARALASVSLTATGEIGRVRLGFAGASSHLLVSQLVRTCLERFPGIHIELFSANFADMALSKILENQYDIALGRWGAVPAGLASRTLVRESFVVAVPIWHPLAARTKIGFGEITAESFIHLPDHPGAVLHERLFELSRRYGVELNSRQAAPDTWTALALVSAGVGVCLTLSTVRENVHFPGVVFLSLEDELEPARLSLAWRSKSDNPAVSSVLSCAEDTLPTAPFAENA